MKTQTLLLTIVSFGLLIRLIGLGQYPSGLSGDEAQQGYSAYSILKTGKDEWGQIFPIFPRSSGDFKPPIYTYLTVPSVALFGLSVEAVRVPSAVIGTILILVVYFLCLELFQNNKVALWSSFLLAINPWHVQLSRTGFEGGPGILLFSLGMLFFLKNNRGKINIILASIFWGLSLYTYHSFRLFTPLFILGLLLMKSYRLKLVGSKKFIAAIIMIIFILPLILNIGDTLTRVSDVGITGQQNITGYFGQKGVSSLPGLIEKLFDNKFVFIANTFWGNYLSYFSPSFYFTGGRPDNSYLNFPGFSLLYLVEIFFWGFALHWIFFKKSDWAKIIILWLIVAPVSASLANGGMSANRAVTLLPLVSLISGLGAKNLVDYIGSKLRIKERIIVILVAACLLVSFLFFSHFYLFTLPQHLPESLRYGYREVFERIVAEENQYKEIVISRVFTQPQIYVAFFAKVDPNYFQQSSQDWLRYEKYKKLSVDQLESWSLGKFKFEDINWVKKDSQRRDALVVSSPNDFPNEVRSILDIYNPQRKLMYRLVPTSP